MDFDTFREEIEFYLPIDFYDEENNKYRDYLLEALEQNWENEKYQFCILATNMLFMSFLYKSFWFLLDKQNSKVNQLVAQNAKMNVENSFLLSPIPEKTFIDNYLSVYGLIPNKKDEVKRLIDIRDDCAHASGEIQYTFEDMDSKFQEYHKQMEVVFNKHKLEVEKAFLKDYQAFLNKNFDTKTTFIFFDNWCRKEKISIKELEVIFNGISNKKLDLQNKDVYLIETSKILLKLYIGLKTYGKINYTFESFKNDLESLLLNYKLVSNDIISYVQNEFNYSYVVMEQSNMDEILELNTNFELDDSMDDFTFSEEKSLLSHIEKEVDND